MILAFQNDGAIPGVLVQPRGLEPATVYSVTDQDSGSSRMETGAALMVDGIEIMESFASAAHVLVLRPVSRAPISVNRPKRHE